MGKTENEGPITKKIFNMAKEVLKKIQQKITQMGGGGGDGFSNGSFWTKTRLSSIESQPKKVVVVVFVVIGLLCVVFVIIVGHKNLTIKFGQYQVIYCSCCYHCFSFVVVVGDPET